MGVRLEKFFPFFPFLPFFLVSYCRTVEMKENTFAVVGWEDGERANRVDESACRVVGWMRRESGVLVLNRKNSRIATLDT